MTDIKKTNWLNKNKKVLVGVANGLGVATVVIGGGIFSMHCLHQIVENQHQRIRKEVREEFENAMAEKQQISDTITYNATQNTK